MSTAIPRKSDWIVEPRRPRFHDSDVPAPRAYRRSPMRHASARREVAGARRARGDKRPADDAQDQRRRYARCPSSGGASAGARSRDRICPDWSSQSLHVARGLANAVLVLDETDAAHSLRPNRRTQHRARRRRRPPRSAAWRSASSPSSLNGSGHRRPGEHRRRRRGNVPPSPRHRRDQATSRRDL